MRHPAPILLPTQPASRGTLLAHGATPQTIRTHLASGDLTRVRRGVFLATSSWPEDPAAQHIARAHAELVVYPDAVVSHNSAALVWGLPHPDFVPWHDAPPSVTLPSDSATSRVGPAVHHVGELPPDQVTKDTEGYAVTTVARTAVDLAAGAALPQALVVLDAAARAHVDNTYAFPRRKDYLSPVVAESARERLRASAATRRPSGLAVPIGLADPARESPAESLSAGHMHLAGLPAPLLQQPVVTLKGTFYPDFLWPELRLIGEVDGLAKYTGPASVQLEKQREQLLRDLGYRIVRWLASEIMLHPAMVMDRIARAMGL